MPGPHLLLPPGQNGPLAILAPLSDLIKGYKENAQEPADTLLPGKPPAQEAHATNKSSGNY
jgi:hypothetical protein